MTLEKWWESLDYDVGNHLVLVFTCACCHLKPHPDFLLHASISVASIIVAANSNICWSHNATICALDFYFSTCKYKSTYKYKIHSRAICYSNMHFLTIGFYQDHENWSEKSKSTFFTLKGRRTIQIFIIFHHWFEVALVWNTQSNDNDNQSIVLMNLSSNASGAASGKETPIFNFLTFQLTHCWDYIGTHLKQHGLGNYQT